MRLVSCDNPSRSLRSGGECWVFLTPTCFVGFWWNLSKWDQISLETFWSHTDSLYHLSYKHVIQKVTAVNVIKVETLSLFDYLSWTVMSFFILLTSFYDLYNTYWTQHQVHDVANRHHLLRGIATAGFHFTPSLDSKI